MSGFPQNDLPADLLARARAGEEPAFAEIYRRYERPVRTLARRLLCHVTTAEDVAQDVFVDVLTRLGQFEGRGSFGGWVRSIAVARCLMHLRSPWQRSRRWLAGAHDDDTVDDGFAAVADPSPTPDRAAQVDLERALARLGDTARAVVWLHDVEGYTHHEIGALFGASASFSKSQLARAHERLRGWLQVDGVGTPCIPVSSIS